ncbi:MAG: hypothetical protein KF886_16985 [Candidatus Hydrogenedentes bacterium]|nr:hypothetical protein [Candidatus Hydrogenedentota bacterium]
MSSSEKTRQKKLMKKRRKEKAKKKQAALQRSSTPERSFVRRADEFPLMECLINDDFTETGMAMIVVARRQSENLVIFGRYGVDLYCMGVKKTLAASNVTLSNYQTGLREEMFEEFNAVPASLELIHQVVYGALDYARDLGFRPHRDFAWTRHVIGPPDAFPRSEELEFGRDGKPLYISGPDDNPKKIVKHLEKRLGMDGFHYIVGGPVL